MNQPIIDFIEQFRRTVPGAEKTYMNGGCVQFAILLTTAFGGQVYYNMDHAAARIDNVFYDITGPTTCPIQAIPIEEYGINVINKILSQCRPK